MNNHRVRKQYIRQIRNALPSRKLKKQIMPQIYDSVCHYMEEHPEADLKRLQEHFGTPYEIAGSYLQELDQGIILRKLRNNRRILATVSSVMVLVMLFFFGYVGSEFARTNRQNHGHDLIITVKYES